MHSVRRAAAAAAAAGCSRAEQESERTNATVRPSLPAAAYPGRAKREAEEGRERLGFTLKFGKRE